MSEVSYLQKQALEISIPKAFAQNEDRKECEGHHSTEPAIMPERKLFQNLKIEISVPIISLHSSDPNSPIVPIHEEKNISDLQVENERKEEIERPQKNLIEFPKTVNENSKRQEQIHERALSQQIRSSVPNVPNEEVHGSGSNQFGIRLI